MIQFKVDDAFNNQMKQTLQQNLTRFHQGQQEQALIDEGYSKNPRQSLNTNSQKWTRQQKIFVFVIIFIIMFGVWIGIINKLQTNIGKINYRQRIQQRANAIKQKPSGTLFAYDILFNPEQEKMTQQQIKIMKEKALKQDFSWGLKYYYQSIQQEVQIIKVKNEMKRNFSLSIVINGLQNCEYRNCIKSIKAALSIITSANNIVWIVKKNPQQQQPQQGMFSQILIKFLKQNKYDYQSFTQVIDASYSFILRHINGSDWFMYANNFVVIKKFVSKISNIKQLVLICNSKDNHKKIRNDTNLVSTSKKTILQSVYLIKVQILKISMPLNFAYQNVYTLDQILILPALALFQRSNTLKAQNFVKFQNLKMPLQAINNGSKFTLKKLQSVQNQQFHHLCFIASPMKIDANDNSDINFYLDSFKTYVNSQKQKKKISIILGIVYNSIQQITESIHSIIQLSRLGLNIRLRIRELEVRQPLQVYEAAYTYCPQNSTIFSSRMNVKPKILQIQKSLNNTNLCHDQKYVLIPNFIDSEGNKSNLSTLKQNFAKGERRTYIPYFKTHFFHAQITCSFLMSQRKLEIFKYQELQFYETQAGFAIANLQRARQHYVLQAESLYQVSRNRNFTDNQQKQYQDLQYRGKNKGITQLQIIPMKYSELNNYGYIRNPSNLIPKIIHQIHLSNNQEPSEFKLVLSKTLREMNPDFQYFLWTWHNVTRKNFPLTYDGVLKFIDISKEKKRNYLALAADILRIQMIYKYGGFYIDFKTEGKRPLQPFLKYEQIHFAVSDISLVNGLIGSVKGDRRHYTLLKDFSDPKNLGLPKTNHFETTGDTKIWSAYTPKQTYTQVLSFQQYIYGGQTPCINNRRKEPLEPGQRWFNMTGNYDNGGQYNLVIPCKRDMQKYLELYDVIGRSYLQKNQQTQYK